VQDEWSYLADERRDLTSDRELAFQSARGHRRSHLAVLRALELPTRRRPTCHLEVIDAIEEL